jgi:Tol biopolymer transport system component
MHRPRNNLLLTPVAVVAAIVFMSQPAMSQSNDLGEFERGDDIGNPQLAGSSSYNAEGQEYMLAGAGANMWDSRDECHFVWRRMKGDFILRSNFEFVDEGAEPHRKLGLMIRTSLDADSPYVDVAMHGSGLVSLQFRKTKLGTTEQFAAPIVGAKVIELQRKGNRYTMRVAWASEPFAKPRAVDVDLGDEVYVGLFVCSHNAEVMERAKFWNVRIVVPAADDLVPYRDYIGSNLEILDVESGRRTVIYRSTESLQAPNWTHDGKSLIYNSNGRLYRFDLESRSLEEMDTGFATANNNDHVLSFDGTMLGISHHSANHNGQSIIYTLPSSGGAPKEVTPVGPSYLHGWSPDGSFLVYTGERGGELDIYKIPIGGGEEIQLTRSPGLDDGPEYSPDGRTIIFNSSRSGTMQIWRMGPEGYDPEQMTDDEFNNWFPHVSPDGQWIVFLSFSSDVAPDDHPFYKHVYLRLMPVGGGPAKVIAYIYGGQGTINVPSWSPDGRCVAFVSNTAEE